jgi:hypothetical protein
MECPLLFILLYGRTQLPAARRFYTTERRLVTCVNTSSVRFEDKIKLTRLKLKWTEHKSFFVAWGGSSSPLLLYLWHHQPGFRNVSSPQHVHSVKLWHQKCRSPKGCTVYQMVDVKVICGDSNRGWEFSKVYTEFSIGIQVLECLLKDTVLGARHTVWTAFETQH